MPIFMDILINTEFDDEDTLPTVFYDDKKQSSTSKRPYKGESLVILPKNYIVIDIETTGLDPQFDEIIELAAVKVENNNIVARYQSLVKSNIEVDPFITDLTGITNEMLENAPPIEQILPDYLNFIGNQIVVGHNVHFDVNFIYDNSMDYLEKPFTNDFINTIRLSRRLFSDVLPNHKLTTIAEHFKLQAPTHRALDDCETVYLFCNLILEHIKNMGISVRQAFENKPKRNSSTSKSYIKASDITTTNTEFDIDHPVYGQCFVFTGTLTKMTRSVAQQTVVDFGGFCTNSVTNKTNYLVLGNLSYVKSVKNGKSIKVKKAESLILQGKDLEIISESVFYDLINP